MAFLRTTLASITLALALAGCTSDPDLQSNDGGATDPDGNGPTVCDGGGNGVSGDGGGTGGGTGGNGTGNGTMGSGSGSTTGSGTGGPGNGTASPTGTGAPGADPCVYGTTSRSSTYPA